jgi:hypothetical protein
MIDSTLEHLSLKIIFTESIGIELFGFIDQVDVPLLEHNFEKYPELAKSSRINSCCNIKEFVIYQGESSCAQENHLQLK